MAWTIAFSISVTLNIALVWYLVNAYIDCLSTKDLIDEMLEATCAKCLVRYKKILRMAIGDFGEKFGEKEE